MKKLINILNKLNKLILKLIRDFFYPLRYEVNDVSKHSDLLYYFNFTEEELKKGGSQKFFFDNDGIPVLPHYLKSTTDGLHYYPISIGQYALAIYHTFVMSKNENDLNRFLKLANWFLNNQSENGFWYSHTDMKKFELEQPWVSAMTQGRAMSVLVRAYYQTNNIRYLEAAKKALSTFKILVEDGGITTKLDGNLSFYQEYPGKTDSYVLNGAIFALWGLKDLHLLDGDKEALELFEKGVNATLSIIDSYDLGYWTQYDLYPNSDTNACTNHYHDIHIKQMKVMYSITKIEKFNELYKKWYKYNKKVNLLKAYYYKVRVVFSRLEL